MKEGNCEEEAQKAEAGGGGRRHGKEGEGIALVEEEQTEARSERKVWREDGIRKLEQEAAEGGRRGGKDEKEQDE